MKQFLFLLFASLSETNVLQQIVPETLVKFDTNFVFEQIIDTNSSLTELFQNNSSIVLSEKKSTKIIEQEIFFDNNYSERIINESDISTEEFHPGPHYEVNWTFIDKETVRIVFSLYSISKLTNEKKMPIKNDSKINIYPNMISIPSRSIQSIDSLKYSLFAIRQYKTNIEKILKMEQLVLKTTSNNDYYFTNSLLLIRLNPKEKYSICIYYYQINTSTQIPDLFICQDILHDHLKHPVHGLLFVLTQYSIILGILIVLQGLFSMRKRRLAHIVHQHLINKTQRLRSTLSSVSLVRQSFSFMDATTEQQNNTINIHTNHEENNKLKKKFISSPAIILTEPSITSDSSTSNSDENESSFKLISVKNHVHFLLDPDDGSDDNQSEDIPNDTVFNVPIHEPYIDGSHALLSMAHILDTNKPWCKHNYHTIPI